MSFVGHDMVLVNQVGQPLGSHHGDEEFLSANPKCLILEWSTVRGVWLDVAFPRIDSLNDSFGLGGLAVDIGCLSVAFLDAEGITVKPIHPHGVHGVSNLPQHMLELGWCDHSHAFLCERDWGWGCWGVHGEVSGLVHHEKDEVAPSHNSWLHQCPHKGHVSGSWSVWVA
jgi:hypothetical protein